jgi:caffeoyl-CoA O-methyltransferase
MIEPEDIVDYATAHSDPEGDYLYRLWRATNIHTVHGHMASGHLQGRLLKMLVMMFRPRTILEVGTFSGYSAICMAEGLSLSPPLPRREGVEPPKCSEGITSPSLRGRAGERPESSSGVRPLITFEINDEMEDFTRKWIEGSDVADLIDFRIGDAVKEAPKLGVMFDMMFFDGDKRTYVETYDALFPLLNKGGIILADNTLWDGHVIDPAYDRDSQTIGIRRFNDLIAHDDRVEKVIVPIRDGLTIIRKK